MTDTNAMRAALDEACALIQEAKGLADGPNGGCVTDHLDFAESWIGKALALLATDRAAGVARDSYGNSANGAFEAACLGIAASPPAPADASGEVERRWKAALKDIADAEEIPTPVKAFAWCREVARTALNPTAGAK